MGVDDTDYDFVVIGSGFGGAVSACRLAEKGYRVAVIEMGKRWAPTDFPATNWSLRRWFWRPGLRLFGFYNMRPFKHVMVLCGNAVGGGSVTYANTMLVPPASVWGEGSWAGVADWRAEMPAHYATAKRMLGVTENQILGDADHMLKRMAEHQGFGDSFYKTDVAVYFGDGPGVTKPDPFFGGKGPARTGCVGCGGCMVGCRFGAKNTLDLNYLHLAEGDGAEILAETRVTELRPAAGATDGSAGYVLETECSTAWFAKRRRTITAKQVVVSASALGSMDLLLRMKQAGHLPALSPQLGTGVRTNSESIVGVRFPAGTDASGAPVDMSKGIAIGSGMHVDQFTHIEATRYSRGSDVLGLMSTLLVAGGGWRRILAWFGAMLRHPVRFARASWPFGFARTTLILLVMQTLDSSLTFRLERRWWWPFTRRLASHGPRIPTNIPLANQFATRAAAQFGGIPIVSTTEILFDLPMTAHCIGGAVMGADAQHGVIDGQHRAYGYTGLYVIDGSSIGANLGVNPSFTITALAERAMTFIPRARSVVATPGVGALDSDATRRSASHSP